MKYRLTLSHLTAPVALSLFTLLYITPVVADAGMLKEAQVTRIVNDVDLIEASDTRRDARTNDIMRDDMVLATGHKSRAELRFTDDTLARIGANSFFTFTEGTRNMELGKGTMLLKVPKGAGGAKVSTQSVTAAITGTTVLLETNPGGPVVLKSGAPIPTPEADEDLRAQGLSQYVNPSIYKTAGRPVPKEQTMWAANAQASPQSIHVAAVTGSVRVMRPGELESTPLKSGDSVPVGSFVFTQGDGNATLNPVPGVATRITPSSTVRVKALDVRVNVNPKVEFELKEGSILSALGPIDRRKIDYKIQTPQGIVAARGTVLGTTSTNGQTGVFGGHGTITFAFDGKQETITPGKFKNFIGQSGNVQLGTDLATNSPAFQEMMQQTLQLVQQAADRGLVRPGLPNDVRAAIRNAGIEPPQIVIPPAGTNTPDAAAGDGSNPPAPQPVARRGNRNTPNAQGGLKVDGNQKEGFSKLIVLEGKMRVYLNDRLGESMVIEPGQMIILNPNANRLPQPVNVDLARLTQTSGLVNGFKQNEAGEGDVRVEQDASGNTILKDPKVLSALKEQKEKLDTGDLSPTGLGISKNRLYTNKPSEPKIEVRNTTENAQGNRRFFTKPSLIPGVTRIGNNSRIVGAPPTVATDGKLVEGSIYRAGSIPLANFAFADGVNGVDQAISIGGGGPADKLEETAAIFRFETLELVGNPEITQGSITSSEFGSFQPTVVGLIGYNNVRISGIYGANSGLGLPDENFIVSENGGIKMDNARFGGFDNNTVFYARNGDIELLNGTQFGLGPNNRFSEVSFASRGNFIMDASSSINADFLGIQSLSPAPVAPILNGNIDAKNIEISASGLINLTTLASFDTQNLTIRSANAPVLPNGLGAPNEAFFFAFDDTTGTGNYNINPVNFDLTASELDLKFSGTNVALNNALGLAPAATPFSLLEIGTNRTLNVNGVTASVTNPNGVAELDLDGSTVNILTGSTISTSANDASRIDINSFNQSLTIDDNVSITSTSSFDNSRIFLGSESDLSIGTSLGTGSSITANGIGESAVNIEAQNNIFIEGSTASVSVGSATSNLGNFFGRSTAGLFNLTEADISVEGNTRASATIKARIINHKAGSIIVSSQDKANIVLESLSGTTIDAADVQAETSVDGPAQISLNNTGSGDIVIKDGSNIDATTVGNSTNQITTVKLENTNGKVIVGDPTGAGASITSTDDGANLDNRPTIFINATDGIQINDSSQLQAVLQAAANGSGLISLSNSSNGDILIANGATITAGEGTASNSNSQITITNSNGNIEIGNATGGANMTAKIITADALGSGSLKIYGGSVLTADQQANLFSQNAVDGLHFVNNGSTTITISSPNTLMKAPVIQVDTGLNVLVGQANAGDVLNIQANTKNWSAAAVPAGSRGDITFNGTVVPNVNTTLPGVGTTGGTFNVTDL